MEQLKHIVHFIKMSNSYNSGMSFWAKCTDISNQYKSLTSLYNVNCHVNASATACIAIASAHAPCCDIQATYHNHECCVLLSVNLSGLFLIHWTPVLRTFMWYLGSPYNWWDTTRKKQSPAPPTSNILKPYCANRDCNNSMTLFGLFPWVTTGPWFNSVSPEWNNFALETQYMWFRFLHFIELNGQHVQIHHERKLILEMSFYVS